MRRAILRTLIVSSLGVVAMPAFGAKKPKVIELDAGTLDIQGNVEVPLYDVPGYEMVPVVAAQVGETRLFLALLPGVDEIALTGPGAAALGLEAKEVEEGINVATVETLQVGELTISGAEVFTTGGESIARWNSNASIGRPNVLSIDGYIGLDAYPALAWAVVPSAGVVRFARGDGGDALVSGVHTPFAPTSDMAAQEVPASYFNPSIVMKQGKSYQLSRANVQTVGTVEGALSTVTIDYQTLFSSVARSMVPADLDTMPREGMKTGMLTLGLGQDSFPVRAIVDGGPDIWDSVDSDELTAKVSLGRNVIGRYDIARNNKTGAIAFKRVEKPRRNDPVPLMLADAEAALKKSMEAPTDAVAEVQKDTTLPKGTAAAWKAVAKAREAAGDYEGSLEAWHTAAKFEPNGCQGWMEYGARVLDYGKPATATDALTKASSLYHSWWDWTPEVRAELGEILEKADEEGQDYYFQPEDIGFVEVQGIREHDVAMGAPAPKVPETGALVKKQPDSCDAADGYLARIELLKGNFDAVEKLYRDTFDLDPYVADIQGTAAVVKGAPQLADEAFRQAIIREWHTGPDPIRRAALAQAYIAREDRASADKLLTRGLELSSNLTLHDQWAENSLALRELGPTIRLAKARAEANPNDPFAQLAAAKLAIDAGREGQAKPDLDRARAALDFAQAYFRTRGSTYVALARYNVLTGNLPMAMEHAKKAIELAPEAGTSWAIGAEVAEAQGDATQAQVYRKKAVQVSPTVVPFAKVLASAE